MTWGFATAEAMFPEADLREILWLKPRWKTMT